MNLTVVTSTIKSNKAWFVKLDIFAQRRSEEVLVIFEPTTLRLAGECHTTRPIGLHQPRWCVLERYEIGYRLDCISSCPWEDWNDPSICHLACHLVLFFNAFHIILYSSTVFYIQYIYIYNYIVVFYIMQLLQITMIDWINYLNVEMILCCLIPVFLHLLFLYSFLVSSCKTLTLNVSYTCENNNYNQWFIFYSLFRAIYT